MWLDMDLRVAGSEPDLLRRLGAATNETEEFGVDFLWVGHNGTLWGAQRKTISDLIASLHDGRLQMELQQAQRLDFGFFIIEGRPKWTTEGKLAGGYGPEFTLKMFNGLMMTIQLKTKFVVFETGSITETAELVQWMEAYSEKEEHLSLFRRPKMQSMWGTADAEDYQSYLLQSIPGVGLKTAMAIIKELGFPLQLRVTKRDLLTVPGVGETTADAIIKATTPTKKKKRRRK